MRNFYEINGLMGIRQMLKAISHAMFGWLNDMDLGEGRKVLS
jgi:hypothetical protein